MADGFGDSKAAPDWYPDFFKWPEIIGLMTRGTKIHNLSRYGAGNEFILQCVRQHYDKVDTVLVQWAIPNRLDLIIKDPDNFWDHQIDQDETYHANTVTLGQDRFWISSASKNPNIRTYHEKYIGYRQHQLRSQTFVEHATLLLKQAGKAHGFLLTWDSEYLETCVRDPSIWHWHAPFKGMHSFRYVSKFADLDFGITQPISLIQFDFIKQFILPRMDLPWRGAKEIDAVENMLHKKYQQALANKHI